MAFIEPLAKVDGRVQESLQKVDGRSPRVSETVLEAGLLPAMLPQSLRSFLLQLLQHLIAAVAGHAEDHVAESVLVGVLVHAGRDERFEERIIDRAPVVCVLLFVAHQLVPALACPAPRRYLRFAPEA